MKLSRIIALLVASAALTAGACLYAAPTVIITIDVESNSGSTLPDQIETTCPGGTPCGLMEIAHTLQQRQIAGTFFLNVYEYRRWGEDVMRGIVQKLQIAGQDVALHTHPQWTNDPNRNGMHQYSLEEQTSIVRDGVRLLSAWSGHPVVAHRAGDYAADERTLKALEANGVHVDSSLFWGHPKSQLAQQGLPRNLPSYRGKVLEIPVTVYERRERPRLFGDISPPLSRIQKVDVDWLLDEEEAKAAVDAVVRADLPFLVVFLHSFSFLAANTSDGAPVANRKSQPILAAILDRVAEKRLLIVTMRDLASGNEGLAPPQSPDVVPVVDVRVSPQRYLWHALRARETRVLMAVGTAFALLLAIAAFLVARIWNGKPKSDLATGQHL